MYIDKIRNNIYFIIFALYYIGKSLFFYMYGLDAITYTNNFQSGSFFLLETLPIYLIIIAKILIHDNQYGNYRFVFRQNIFKYFHKKIVNSTIVFILIQFLITLVFMVQFYNIHSIRPLFSIVWTCTNYFLGYLFIAKTVMILKQYDVSYCYLYVYLFFSAEYFIVFEGILSKNIPLLLTWLFYKKTNNVFKILILCVLNGLAYNKAYNVSLEREFR